MKYAEYVKRVADDNFHDVYSSMALEIYDDLKKKIMQQSYYGRHFIHYSTEYNISDKLKELLLNDGFRISCESKAVLGDQTHTFLTIHWD